jgi:signal transduction histidine kinase
LTLADADLPPIRADETLVRHALTNLVGNALDAVDAGGAVEVAIESSGEFQRAIVRDDGPGPEPTVASRLGEPFATGKPTGVGLGLTVVRAVAERAGGAFEWRRTADGRTEFVLALPARLG